MYPAKRILEERREIVPFQDSTEKTTNFCAAISSGTSSDHEEASQPTKLGVVILVHVLHEQILEEWMEN